MDASRDTEAVSGAAVKAGIQAGDVIVSLNGTPISKPEQLQQLVQKAGKHVALLAQLMMSAVRAAVSSTNGVPSNTSKATLSGKSCCRNCSTAALAFTWSRPHTWNALRIDQRRIGLDATYLGDGQKRDHGRITERIVFLSVAGVSGAVKPCTGACAVNNL